MMPRRLATPLLFAVLGWTFPACGGGSAAPTGDAAAPTGDAAARSGIAPQKLVRDLTDAELRTLCDWGVSLSGGYGRVTTCDGGLTARAKADQQACVDSVNQSAACTAKVQDVETCTIMRAANPCDVSIALGPQCAPVLTCS
jgi:hypothetical protein